MRAGTMDVHRVAVIGDRFVAIGGDQGSFGLWSSSDGRSWRPAMFDTPSAVPTGLGWGAMIPVRGITVAGPRVMATGPMGTGIWISSDGLDWRQVFGGEQAVGLVLTDLAAAPDGTAVAIGRGPSRVGRWPPSVWRSDDGKTWSQAADLGVFASSSPDTDATLERIVWADGVFVVLGTEPRSPGTGEDGQTRLLAWSSVDGVSWRRETPDPAFESASLSGVMRCGDRLMVTGRSDAAPGVAAWTRAADSFGGPSGTQAPGPRQPATTVSVPGAAVASERQS